MRDKRIDSLKRIESKNKLDLYEPKMHKKILEFFVKFNFFRMSTPPSRQVTFAPAKGSFPLDHFKECETHYKEYMSCLKTNQNNASSCRDISRSYLE